MVHAFLDLLSFFNEVFGSYVYLCAIFVIKFLLMVPWKTYFQLKKKAPANPEAAKVSDEVFGHRNVKMNLNDPEVERVRRGHLNNLENILPYLFAGLFFVLTNSAVTLATTLLKVAALARIAHSIVYTVILIPEPARGTAWAIHFVITSYMAVSVVLYSK